MLLSLEDQKFPARSQSEGGDICLPNTLIWREGRASPHSLAPPSSPGTSLFLLPLHTPFFPGIYTWFWRRQWHPTPVLLPGKSHGWRSLVSSSPWGRQESDTTERFHFHFSLSCIGEGNGNPLQSSCLENPRDGGVCWAAVYGVTQSPT